MRRRHTLFTLLALPVVALALSLTGCVDEKVVYRDRELFATPPTGAAGFLGYSKAEAKLTVCGNCHIGQQTRWQETAHSGAFTKLSGTAHPDSLFTVNGAGNATSGGGWVATKDTRYQDVQCESCHGPGLTHVQNPSKGTVASVLAPVALNADLSKGCAECHTSVHWPYADEWKRSMHGGGTAINSAGTRAECKGCHTGEDALITFGVNANYTEKAEYLASSTLNMPITCSVCHDPHAKNFTGQLRFPIDVPDEEGNLCMKCHHKRGVNDPTTQRGPHSPEGPVLLGYGGWWPPNMVFPGGTIQATHGSQSNPKLCAGCHLPQLDVKNAAGAVVGKATSHTFEAIPCLEANGTAKVNCSEELASTQRTYRTCTGAGCHGSEAVARSAVATVDLRIGTLTAELDRLLERVQPGWKTCRNLQIPAGSGRYRCSANPTEFDTGDGRYTTAEGAAFNYDLGVRKSASIHNPFLVEALLIATIRQVKQDYNITGATLVDLEPQLKGMK